MTLLSARRVANEIVLCGDSQETITRIGPDGLPAEYRKAVQKIIPKNMGNYSVTIAGSGHAALIESFIVKLERRPTPNAGHTDTPPVSPDQAAAAELEVSSTPDGADIEIDGNFVGSTPSTVGVAAGPHQLSLKKAGFKPWERKITVSSGHIKIDATLESQSN
jgi:hypothetical protein